MESAVDIYKLEVDNDNELFKEFAYSSVPTKLHSRPHGSFDRLTVRHAQPQHDSGEAVL